MFGFFDKNSSRVEVSDKIWLSREAKWNACLKMINVYPACVFVSWFHNTKEELSRVFNDEDSKSRVVLAKDLKVHDSNAMYIFVEHYPLQSHEQHLFVRLGLKDVPVLSSLDDHLFTLFGGDRMVRLMENLGVEGDEIIGHTMINQAIRRAQAKIEKKVKKEIPAESQEAWFEKNWKQNS